MLTRCPPPPHKHHHPCGPRLLAALQLRGAGEARGGRRAKRSRRGGRGGEGRVTERWLGGEAAGCAPAPRASAVRCCGNSATKLIVLIRDMCVRRARWPCHALVQLLCSVLSEYCFCTNTADEPALPVPCAAFILVSLPPTYLCNSYRHLYTWLARHSLLATILYTSTSTPPVIPRQHA